MQQGRRTGTPMAIWVTVFGCISVRWLGCYLVRYGIVLHVSLVVPESNSSIGISLYDMIPSVLLHTPKQISQHKSIRLFFSKAQV